MGKKHAQGSLKRLRDEDDEQNEEMLDPELDAEIQAVMSIRAEKENSGFKGLRTDVVPVNNEALEKLNESFATSSLSFVESMQIGEFDVNVEDENDDLAREVSRFNSADFLIL